MILVFGEILFDQFPDYKRIGGAPFNFSYHLVQFGLPVRFVSRIGADPDGREIMTFLEDRHFPTADIQVDPGHRTGLVRVELSDGGVPDFEIVPDVAYDHIDYSDLKDLPDPADVDMIYFGSVLQRTDAAHQALHRFIADHYPKARIFFDINLRTGCINNDAVMASLKKANLLKLNEDELEYLRKMIGPGDSPEEFIRALITRYPLDMLALTRGDRGSDLYLPGLSVSAEPGQMNRLADTVGAGDAYSSMMALGFVRKWPPEKIIRSATDFAARICEIQGAVPDGRAFYGEFAGDAK